MPKVYTTWVFKGHDPVNSYHCTGNYFGPLKLEHQAKLIAMLEELFDGYARLYTFKATFDRPALFGPNKDTSVLEVSPRDLDRFYWIWGHIKLPKATYGFRPHVTLLEHDKYANIFIADVVDYVVVSDKKIIWSAAEHSRRQG